MVVAFIRVGLVTWLAQYEALVTGREIWAGQSWCETGKASGRLESVSHVDRWRLFYALTLLSLTARASERATTRSWHLSVLSLLHHSAGEHCRELVLGHQPKLQETHISSSCTTSCPMGGYRVPTAVDEGSSTTLISVPCHGPRDSWKSTRAMDAGSSTLPTFLCETSMCPTSLQTCEEKSEPELTLRKRQVLNFFSIFYLNKKL